MPAIFLYLVKLSMSLAVVYLFYQFVLRRLTFYNWNRFYLLCYTVLSFLIPFINITPVLVRNEMADSQVVRFIPAVGNFNDNIIIGKLPANVGTASGTSWHWILFFVLTGIAVMLVRLVIQLLSFKKIINKAQLVSDKEVKLYQVNQPIIPFSIGNSIFINRQLHNDEELSEIIRHEFVHVKQKHTADMAWSELLCILNWYNPLVWMIRKAMRQNLEFIADHKVLESGIDKKQYQYLLLKVIGNNHFSIASQFNFSSLKKRIAMMNKMKSAKMHVTKFLFALPLIMFLVLSFRSRISVPETNRDEPAFFLSGMVYDNETELPLPDVLMIEARTGIRTRTDINGFYAMDIPTKKNDTLDIVIRLSKEGYINNDRRLMVEFIAHSSQSGIGIFSLLNKADFRERLNHTIMCSTKDENGMTLLHPDYAFVKRKFDSFFEPGKRRDKPGNLAGNAESLADKTRAENTQTGIKIFLIEDIHLDAEYPINNRGYYIEIQDNKGNCNVVVKNKKRKEIKRLLLTEWNNDKEHYEELYGKILPVAEINKEGFKTMPLKGSYLVAFDKNGDSSAYAELEGQAIIKDSILGTSELHLTSVAFNPYKSRVNKTMTITADSVMWSRDSNQLSFRGNAFLYDESANVRLNSDIVMLKDDLLYFLLDGKEPAPDKNYINYTRSTYNVIYLEKENAIKKYGDKAKNGAVEMISQN